MTDEPGRLRRRATALIDMAMRAFERGEGEFGEQCVERAMTAMDEVDRVEVRTPPHQEPQQRVAQQQQQIQRKDNEDKD